jgi:hypothetical protein
MRGRGKRSRNADAEAAQALRYNPAIIEAIQTYASLSEEQQKMLLQAYSSLTPEQRHSLWEHQKEAVFRLLPEPIWKIIAFSNVGVMMNLAIAFHVRPPARNLLQDILRTEVFWQGKFAEDYPLDFKFCRGVLPFYVLHERHPLYTPGSVPDEDRPAWKRYYLHTAHQYHMFAVDFAERYEPILGPVCSAMQIEYLDGETATAAEIYRWVHRVILGLHFNEYDYQAPIAWVFVCTFVWFVSPSDTPSLDSREIIRRFWSYARRPRFEWMIPYLTHSKAYLLHSHEKKVPKSYHESVARGFLSPRKLKEVNRIVAKYEKDEYGDKSYMQPEFLRFLQAFPSPHNWRKANLFSPKDREEMMRFLGSSALDITIPFWPDIDPNERHKRQKAMARMWECLEACCTIPCISSAYFGSVFNEPMYFAPQIVHMQIHSRQIQKVVRESITMLPPDMPLRLPVQGWDDKQNTWPRQDVETSMLGKCCAFNDMTRITPNMFEDGDDLYEQFFLNSQTFRRALWYFARSPRERADDGVGKIKFIESNLGPSDKLA